MNDSKSTVRPRPWRLQFSLKLLLIAFTAFAIGFPIWYRWPYEEREIVNPTTTRITTWQRQWGGGKLKHGLEHVRRNLGALEEVQSITYRNGRKDGPYQYELGPVGQQGQYADDLKDGIWLSRNKSMVTRTESWSRGKLHGPMEIKQPPARPIRAAKAVSVSDPRAEWRTIHVTFSDGRITHFNGQPMLDSHGKSATNRLFELQGTGAIDVLIDAELGKQTTIDIVEMPVKDVMLYLSESHNMHLVLDSKLGKNVGLPITCYYQGIDLGTALLLLTAPHGLSCDYRYGCVWITTAEDGNDWHDPTGVSQIKPPAGTALARAWNEISPPVDCVQTPLTEVLAYLKQPLAIDIDTSHIEETTADSSPPLVTLSLRGQKFCHTLGQLLYKTGCRCRLEGDKLVIMPPQQH